jgi:hypothetical protein
VVISSILISLIIPIVLFVKSDSVILVRVRNILIGNDSSGSGRTFDSLYLAYKIAKEKSLIFGSGLGQIKVLGEYIIRPFYRYPKSYIPVVTIPNSIGELIATFGFLGLFIKISFEVALFYIRKTHLNYYSLFLFTFIFIYQFTGSFLTNIVEYVIWIIAFSNIFSEFNNREKPSTLK